MPRQSLKVRHFTIYHGQDPSLDYFIEVIDDRRVIQKSTGHIFTWDKISGVNVKLDMFKDAEEHVSTETPVIQIFKYIQSKINPIEEE